jgi:uncharacterized protein
MHYSHTNGMIFKGSPRDFSAILEGMSAETEGSPSRSIMLADLGRVLAARPLNRQEVEAASAWTEEIQGIDLVDAVDTLVAEGMPEERLKTAVSRLLNLVSRPLAGVHFEPSDPFFASLVLENEAFLARLDALRPLVARLASNPDQSLFKSLRLSLGELPAMNIHYIKKEHVLFPYFEARYPRYRCLSLMWSLHDDVREALSKLALVLDSTLPGTGRVDARQAGALLGRLFFDAHALVIREEKLLFPLVAGLLSPEERSSLYFEAKALGFCFLEPEKIEALELSAEGPAKGPRRGPSGEAGTGPASDSRLDLDAGFLSPDLVDLILKSLPVDLTFVDAEDRVAYFSNSRERVFPRSAAIIGRDVRNCHPAKSLDRVLGIIGSFKKGEKDTEEFWLEHAGRFIRIEYRAIRDEGGAYLGTLEISQDLTASRALKGEKRLPG